MPFVRHILYQAQPPSLTPLTMDASLTIHACLQATQGRSEQPLPSIKELCNHLHRRRRRQRDYPDYVEHFRQVFARGLGNLELALERTCAPCGTCAAAAAAVATFDIPPRKFNSHLQLMKGPRRASERASEACEIFQLHAARIVQYIDEREIQRGLNCL